MMTPPPPPNDVGVGPHPIGPKEIDGLHVPPGKASLLLADHLIAG